MPRVELLKTTTFTGSRCAATVMSSPSSIDRPPSPETETTCRPGYASWAPIACGSALAMDPCRYEPISRRVPSGLMYRAVQTLHMPVSAVKIASLAATWSSSEAAYSGWIGCFVPTLRVYAPTAFFMRRSCLFSIASRKRRLFLAVTNGMRAARVGRTSPCTATSTSVRRPSLCAARSTCAVRVPGRNWSYGKSVPSRISRSASSMPSAAAP
ncbi:hypothetical protein SRABI128_06178 [Microbacterium sp. Bi128]|nr:hypothetical protein SRABI128_06178 [Microbacterium sp. Bi128]